MSKIHKLVLAGALAFATAVPAVAAPPMSSAPLSIEKSSDVTKVACWRCRGWRGRGWRGRHWGYRGRYWGPRIVIAPTVVVRPRKHLAWCGPRGHRYRCWVRY